MPRGAKKNANQHNNRHENGVVAPGKRITKQKSNGHLNGNPDGKLGEHAPPVPTAATASSQTASHVHTNGSVTVETRAPGPKQERKTSLTVDVTDGGQSVGGPSGFGDRAGEQNHRKIDSSSAARPFLSNDGGMVPLALTVLASCPLRDTLAILIFLLSLPPTIVTITNALFAALTFVPPSGSFTAMPTIADLTSSFSPGTPSFIVSVLIDIVAMSMWLWFPKDAQALALDVAQAMVATTLGGGSNNNPGGSDNTLLCVFIVVLTHLARYRPLLMKQLHRTYLGRWTPIAEYFDPDYVDSRYPVGERGWLGTVKVLIALHIVGQGFTRLVRRILQASRNSMTIPPSTNKSTDPEASIGYPTGSELPDHAANPPQSLMELKPRHSLQKLNEGRDNKVSSGKRRRKQANYVRSQQPFWAAFAATKATIVREYELSRANGDAINSNATDRENFGNAPFATSDNRVWITAVNDTGFYFETSPLAPNRRFEKGVEAGDAIDEAGIDRSKPLYVRCNGMDWSTTRIESLPKTQDEKGRRRWVGEVSMLSPGKTYEVSFLSCVDNEVLQSETVATSANEQAIITPTTATFKHPRPSSPASPTATLKNSIAVLEARIAEATNRRQRDKKEHKAASNQLKKEIEGLQEKRNRYSGREKDLRNREVQQNQQMRQAEDAITSITKELESYTDIPEEELAEWKEFKANLEDARDENARAQEDHIRTKESNTKSFTERQSEAMSVQHRQERLQARLKKLGDQHKRLTSDDADGSTEAEPSTSGLNPAAKPVDFSNLSHHNDPASQAARYEEQILNFRQQAHALNHEVNDYKARIAALENAAAQAAEAASSLEHESRPDTPEGDLPGTNPTMSSAASDNRFYGTPESHYIPMANGRSHHGNGFSRSDSARERSTSGFSGDMYFDEDDMLPPKVKRRSGFDNVREGSDGSGGSGGGSPGIRYRGKSSPSPGMM